MRRDSDAVRRRPPGRDDPRLAWYRPSELKQRNAIASATQYQRNINA
jgi:hypothetical protein